MARYLLTALTLLCGFVTPHVLPRPVQAADVVWLEAEQFDDLGGWFNDAQFIDQMGSPYLMAYSLDGPVRDAVTKIDVPAAGKYRLWVRCRDWVPEFSPGRFKVVLGDQEVEQTFGANRKPHWMWEDGGAHDLSAGDLSVRLHDLTGHYARCDALMLTTDLKFLPPSDVPLIADLRLKYGGLSREIKRLEPYDTVVVGGGLAGTMAAVASARMGCRTALIQNRPVLGGNGSVEVLVNPEGDMTFEPLDPGETGIIEEFRGASEGYSARMLEMVKQQKDLDLFLNTHATGVEMKDAKQIAAVEAVNVVTGQRLLFPGAMFIDCTGDGVIGIWAGAEYRKGREPRSMYNESRAPKMGDARTMGGTLRYKTQRMLEPQAFAGQPWARQFLVPGDFAEKRCPLLEYGGWQWRIEYGGMRDTYWDAEEVRDELLRIIWGMWDYAKNRAPEKKDAEKYLITWISHVTGKRESYRLMGDYVMTQKDVEERPLLDDRVSYAGWGIDIHPPDGYYTFEPPAIITHKYKFSIPFRSLYSKNIDNLMMAGRCISVSHVALGATRVMITCGLQGQAVGTAAGWCKRFGVDPRALGREHIAALQQQLLKDGCYLIDLPNRDPRDLARAAKVKVSSEATTATLESASTGEAVPLDTLRAAMFEVTADRIDRINLHLISTAARPTRVELKLYQAHEFGEFTGREVATATASLRPRQKGWVGFVVNRAVEPGPYYVELPPTESVSWSLMQTQPQGTMRAYNPGDFWHRDSTTQAVRLDPPSTALLPEPVAGADPKRPFAAEQVINGYARAIRGWPNAWRPAQDQRLPQWVELDFGKPVSMNTVHVSFQSQLMSAEDFRLEVPDGDGWKPIVTVNDNRARRRVLTFDRLTADKLRLVLIKAHPDVAVCEIRVYDEPSAGN